MATKSQECPQVSRKHAGTLVGAFGYTHTRVCVLTELLTDLMMPVNTFCCLALKPLLSGLVFPRILSFTGGLSGIFFFFLQKL